MGKGRNSKDTPAKVFNPSISSDLTEYYDQYFTEKKEKVPSPRTPPKDKTLYGISDDSSRNDKLITLEPLKNTRRELVVATFNTKRAKVLDFNSALARNYIRLTANTLMRDGKTVRRATLEERLFVIAKQSGKDYVSLPDGRILVVTDSRLMLYDSVRD
jgi:hypothetical protein